MKKKFYMMIVLAMFAMSALTGCGNEKNENTGTDGTHINGTEGTAIDNRDGVVGDVITDVSEELTEMGDDIKDAVEGGSQATTAVETTQSTQAR